MRPPKILPWLARRARLPLDRAEALCHTSVKEFEAHQAGRIGDPAHWPRLMAIVCRRMHLAGTMDGAEFSPQAVFIYPAHSC